MKARVISISFFVLLLFYSTCQAKVYEYKYTPSSSIDASGFAHYKIYIPNDIDTIRGVYCYVPGWQGSSLDKVADTCFLEYVKEKDFAFMGFEMLGTYTDFNLGISLWSGAALITALKELSLLSAHPELEYSSLLFYGHSAGGQFSYHFTQWKPKRVIAFVTSKGGYHSLAPVGEAQRVPGYMFIGENDKDYRISNLTTIFEANRPGGAIWTLAMQPNSEHGRVPIEIIHSYFDQIIPLRIPDNIPLNSIPGLNAIEEHKGWLGDRDTYDIELYASYMGDLTKACWFPNEKIAKQWQNFVQDLPISYAGLPIGKLEKNYVLNVYPNPTTGIIHFEYPGMLNNDIHFQIFNLKGQILTQGKSKGNIIDDFDFKSGIYILKLNAHNEILSEKIVIK